MEVDEAPAAVRPGTLRTRKSREKTKAVKRALLQVRTSMPAGAELPRVRDGKCICLRREQRSSHHSGTLQIFQSSSQVRTNTAPSRSRSITCYCWAFL